MNRKLILYIACSLDGYIAKSDNDLSFLKKVQMENEDYGYNEFVSTTDTIIIGRKTIDWVINQGFSYPHKDKKVYIITRTQKPDQGNITFYTDDIKELVTGLKKIKEKTSIVMAEPKLLTCFSKKNSLMS